MRYSVEFDIPSVLNGAACSVVDYSYLLDRFACSFGLWNSLSWVNSYLSERFSTVSMGSRLSPSFPCHAMVFLRVQFLDLSFLLSMFVVSFPLMTTSNANHSQLHIMLLPAFSYSQYISCLESCLTSLHGWFFAEWIGFKSFLKGSYSSGYM